MEYTFTIQSEIILDFGKEEFDKIIKCAFDDQPFDESKEDIDSYHFSMLTYIDDNFEELICEALNYTDFTTIEFINDNSYVISKIFDEFEKYYCDKFMIQDY